MIKKLFLFKDQVIPNEYYKEDLAFIHDVGFADYALQSAPGLLEILKQNQIGEGLVVDLGCGSGLWALELTKAHYQVLAIESVS